MKVIRDITTKTYIVAYQENTMLLEKYFQQHGFSVQVFRHSYTEEELNYSACMRCLLNHRDVWHAIAEDGCDAIVIEADFVPIRNFGDSYAPFDPELSPTAIGWLYAGGPVLYRVDNRGYAIGHSSTTVAMIITAKAAPALIEFANKEIERHDGKYVPWDTYLSHRLRRLMDVPTYIPFKQYGEHGGSPNPEHKTNKIRNWHQADILADRLAFLPPYAKGNLLTYRLIRLRANLRGLARIVIGKYVEPTSFKVSNQKMRLIRFTLCRWLTRRTTFHVFNAEN